MKEFQRLRASAKKRFQTADHFLTVTYPRLDDPKLLLSALEHLYRGFENAMDAVLEHQQLFKNIDPVGDSFEERFDAFESIAQEHGLDTDHVKELRSVLACHEESPVEFPKDGKYVICDDDFVTETLTEDRLKTYCDQGKEFWEQVAEVTQEHERIFE
ncbi:MAG: hypothetical protein ABEI52_10410 [Halobacteriaceae archaeon]